MKLFTTIALALSFSISSFAAVWESDKSWSDEEEVKYSQWVKDNWTTDIFTSPSSPYYGIPTDCADAGYAMRIIYSYENNLPFNIYSRRLKKNISNKLRKWDRNPDRYLNSSLYPIKDPASLNLIKRIYPTFSHEKKKLFHFINLVSSITSTWSLPNDTYPVKLGPETIKPGLISLVRRYHTYTISDVNEFGIVTNMSSTVPPQVRSLSMSSDIQSFSGVKYEEGILAFKWPGDAKKASHRIQKSSIEQYNLWAEFASKYFDKEVKDINFTKISTEDNYKILKDFQYAIKFGHDDIPALALNTESVGQSVKRLMGEYCQYAQERTEVVRASVEYRESVNRCLNAEEVDLHSTPSRDRKLKQKLYTLVALAKEEGISNELSSDELIMLYAIWEATILAKSPNYQYQYYGKYKFCEVETFDGRKYSLDEFSYGIDTNLFSSDPNDPIETRWGLSTQGNDCNQPI